MPRKNIDGRVFDVGAARPAVSFLHPSCCELCRFRCLLNVKYVKYADSVAISKAAGRQFLKNTPVRVGRRRRVSEPDGLGLWGSALGEGQGERSIRGGSKRGMWRDVEGAKSEKEKDLNRAGATDGMRFIGFGDFGRKEWCKYV